ncbi:MAG: HPr(Ser) kinase/phosphatase [Clostridia bacterium]|nr:HPr(Ser) kinase/phosphatase [Clostridia bacterium]MBQ3870098.1 HPr(Ser) kinase/phosphatase [Clostridia bacterium]
MYDVNGNGKYSIPLSAIVEEFDLQIIYAPDDYAERTIKRSDVNRPGLKLAGFGKLFDPDRIQLIGKVEYEYLCSLMPDRQLFSFTNLVSDHPVCIIFTTELPISDEQIEVCRKYSVPLLRTKQRTSAFMAALIASLNVSLAPRITRHGVLVEVYGEGILMLGDSGVGKSETAIELVKRGHRLIADDAVEIKRVSATTLVGSAPEIIRHYVELRGIGIVDVRRIFGMGAVKLTEKIDLVIVLEQWVQGKMYDRFGLDQEYTEILGINVPSITIPVRPGRNLAVILEIAAMNNRQKKMGYNTALEFNKRLMGQTGGDENK